MQNRVIIKNILIATLLFLITLVPRIRHIAKDEPQPDEIHWEHRSYGVVEHYRSGQLANLTTHLHHPGIPPALLMGLSEVIAEKVNLARAVERGEPGYISRLKSSRMVMAISASLIVPALFLLLFPLVGFRIALLSASLLAFDPMHISLSRMAHLDAFLTLLVTLCFFTFVYATRKNSRMLFFLSAFFWSLCILTKPTAAAILAGLFSYRLFKIYFAKEKLEIISFLDYWLCYFALAFFSFFYTRLWFYHHTAKYKLDISGQYLKSTLYHYGHYLNGHLIYSSIISCVFLICLLYFFLKKKMHLFQVTAIFLSLFLPLFLIPQVVENFVGFWSWVVGLSGEKHEAWGKVWEAPRYGYLEIFLRRTPTLIICAVVVGLCFIGTRFKKLSAEEKALYLSLICSVMLWVLPLNISSKQSYRYLMPVIPFVYAIAAFGLVKLCRSKMICLVLPIAIQIYTAIDSFPEPGLFFNNLSGGLKAAKAAGAGLPFSGQNDALKYLQVKSVTEHNNYLVGVLGDATTLQYAYRSLYPKDSSRLLFSQITVPHALDYILVYGSFHNLPFDTAIPNVGRMKKVFTHSHKGEELLALYDVPYPHYKDKVEFNLISGLPGSAHKQKTPAGEYFLEATPGGTQKGYLVYGLNARVTQGRYRVDYELGIPEHWTQEIGLPSDTAVASIEFGSGCAKTILLSDLSKERRKFSLKCTIEKKDKRQFRVYWLGQSPLALYRMVYVEKSK